MASAAPFKKRITTIMAVTKDDPTATKLIEEVISSISHYRDTIINMKRLEAMRFRCDDGVELRETTERLDNLKHRAHNRLLDALTVANRYLFRTFGKAIPVGGVYTDDPLHLYGNKDRYAITAWAEKVSVQLQ